jgi:hypothetical protein
VHGLDDPEHLRVRSYGVGLFEEDPVAVGDEFFHGAGQPQGALVGQGADHLRGRDSGACVEPFLWEFHTLGERTAAMAR